MVKIENIEPFVPAALPPESKPEAMVVVTVRLPKEDRVALRRLWGADPSFKSFSHVVQVAVRQFLERQQGSA